MVCLAVIFPLHAPKCLPDLPAAADAVPAFGVLASLFLILQLQWETWVRFAVWLVIGLIIYFAYGPKHSLLSPLHERAPASPTDK